MVTPNGALLAPNAVELRLNPRDYDSLAERIDIGLAASSAADVYAEQAAAHEARFAGYGPAEVTLLRDPAVPAGTSSARGSRWEPRRGPPSSPLRRTAARTSSRGRPGRCSHRPSGRRPGPSGSGWPVRRPPPNPAPGPPPAMPGLRTRPARGPLARRHPLPPGRSRTTAAPRPRPPGRPRTRPRAPRAGLPTVAEPARNPVPQLRLITGDYVSQTRTSGARAGRGAVELALPDVPTVSREHARFTYSDGQWWIANLGLNGLMLNGSSLAGEHPLHGGDSIRWGRSQESPESRVEIGSPRGRRRAGGSSSSGGGRAARGCAARPRRSPGWTGACSAQDGPELHRPPRCAGPAVRAPPVGAVQPGHQLPGLPGAAPGRAPRWTRGVEQAAQHVLPVAPALRYETVPVRLRPGHLAGQRRELGPPAAAGGPSAGRRSPTVHAGPRQQAAPRRSGSTPTAGPPGGQPATAGRGLAGPGLLPAQRHRADGDGLSTTRSTSWGGRPAAGPDDGRRRRAGPVRRGGGLRLQEGAAGPDLEGSAAPAGAGRVPAAATGC